MKSALADSLTEAKERLTIPALWQLLRLPGDPPPAGDGVCRSPFRDDKNPSLSVFGGGRAFKDFATGEGGDAVAFLRLATGLEGRALCDRFRELAGIQAAPAGGCGSIRFPVRGVHPKGAREEVRERSNSRSPAGKTADMRSMRRPTREELKRVAAQRKLSLQGVALAAHRGFLRTGIVRGHDCWVCSEWSGRIATARRMDGRPFDRADGGAGYKSHSLSSKRWPAGLCGLPLDPSPDAAVLLVEGEGDFLAAFHFMAEWGEPNLYPAAFLGRTLALRPEVVRRLAGWRVRVFPHADADGGGWTAARRWAAAIPGADVDAFDFTGLRMADGSPVKDLNDCASINEEDAEALDEMNPLPPRRHLDPARAEFDFQNDTRAIFWGELADTDEDGLPVLRAGTVIPF